ncbi:universal stress protein [Peristeroidobacter agariperforans]|uniref:universal stress protein n=1 Tax=Peristeroidobacter agariperforans TaxID=268404 RepID=UPI00101CA042|nr:universal stress protein [Peristeroidobacter agariperforans]
MPRLLCATDLLPKSEAAIDRAGMLAEQLQAQLSLLHVVSPTTSELNLEQALQLAITGLKSRARAPEWRFGPLPEVAVRTGGPARLIIDSIDKHQVDLVVIGPHRKRGLRDVLEGTIAEKILNTRQCPLLIVRRPAEAGYQQVMLALDVSEESAAAVQAAEALILNARTQSMVMHVSEPPYQGMMRSAGVGTEEVISYVNHSRREAAAEIRELLKRTSADHTRYGVVIGDSHPARAIRRAVEMYQPDLLVMGTNGGRVRRALIGSIASQVMDAADCDVLVVPRGSVPARKARLH